MNIIPSSRVRRLVESSGLKGIESLRSGSVRPGALRRAGMYKTILGEAGAWSAWRLTSHGQRIFA